MKKIMECGYAANGVCSSQNGIKYDPPIDCCVIHGSIKPKEIQPDLTGRIAKCIYRDCQKNLKGRKSNYGQFGEDGKSYAPSSMELPFFKYCPDKKYDEYYCGCMGWD